MFKWLRSKTHKIRVKQGKSGRWRWELRNIDTDNVDAICPVRGFSNPEDAVENAVNLFDTVVVEDDVPAVPYRRKR